MKTTIATIVILFFAVLSINAQQATTNAAKATVVSDAKVSATKTSLVNNAEPKAVCCAGKTSAHCGDSDSKACKKGEPKAACTKSGTAQTCNHGAAPEK